jgi:hypothetical protein
MTWYRGEPQTAAVELDGTTFIKEYVRLLVAQNGPESSGDMT